MVRTFKQARQAGDLACQKEIVLSFCKFKTLPKAAEPFFADIQDPELQKCVEDVRTYFKKKASGGK